MHDYVRSQFARRFPSSSIGISFDEGEEIRDVRVSYGTNPVEELHFVMEVGSDDDCLLFTEVNGKYDPVSFDFPIDE